MISDAPLVTAKGGPLLLVTLDFGCLKLFLSRILTRTWSIFLNPVTNLIPSNARTRVLNVKLKTGRIRFETNRKIGGAREWQKWPFEENSDKEKRRFWKNWLKSMLDISRETSYRRKYIEGWLVTLHHIDSIRRTPDVVAPVSIASTWCSITKDTLYTFPPTVSTEIWIRLESGWHKLEFLKLAEWFLGPEQSNFNKRWNKGGTRLEIVIGTG